MSVPAGEVVEEMVTVPRITEGGIGTIQVNDDGLKADNVFYLACLKSALHNGALDRWGAWCHHLRS